MNPSSSFDKRHIGPSPVELAEMLATIGVGSLEQLIDETVPSGIKSKPLNIPAGLSEYEYLLELLKALPVKINCINRIWVRDIMVQLSFCDCAQRISKPGMKTPNIRPYQAEIAQGD